VADAAGDLAAVEAWVVQVEVQQDEVVEPPLAQLQRAGATPPPSRPPSRPCPYTWPPQGAMYLPVGATSEHMGTGKRCGGGIGGKAVTRRTNRQTPLCTGSSSSPTRWVRGGGAAWAAPVSAHSMRTAAAGASVSMTSRTRCSAFRRRMYTSSTIRIDRVPRARHRTHPPPPRLVSLPTLLKKKSPAPEKGTACGAQRRLRGLAARARAPAAPSPGGPGHAGRARGGALTQMTSTEIKYFRT